MHPQEGNRFNLRALLILSFGHMATDIFQGALPAILPFLKERLSLSYSMAGIIILASNLTSSVVQPFFGIISDREVKPLLLPAGCLIAGIGFALLPLSSGYLQVLFLVVVSGLGIASFHPEGFKTAHRFIGARPAVGMSVFSFGGNLGFALGPIISLFIVTRLGFSSLSLMLVFSLLFLAVLCPLWKNLNSPKTKKPGEGQKKASAGSLYSSSIVILVGTVIVRSWIHAGLTSYIPFYYIDYLGGDPVQAGKLVSSFLIGGVVGTLAGAPLADRWGHKQYLILSMLAASLLFPFFFLTEGASLAVLLFIFGMVLISTFTVTMVMAQRVLPGNLGMASGLMVGFAIGTGGIGVTLLGIIADHSGVPAALKSIAVLPVAGFFLSLFLKYPRQA